ncbi:MAG: cytidylate kinase-like family protein [Anaerolineales bacterium]|nr:cytidylate kinase-like family protein [Anaerolineales bacterium]
MAAITISRQLGSLGSEVAQAVAARLGWRVIWRELINQAAREAGAGEMALATIDDLNLLGLRPRAEVRQAYLDAIARLMDEAASQGKVIILGRAGQVVLRERADTLHMRIIAPLTLRAERVAARQGISLQAAEAQVQASDRARRRYVQRFYHMDWDDSSLYDLIINTRRMAAEPAAELVCLALRHYGLGSKGEDALD